MAGTKSEDVITVLKKIDEEQRYAVMEVTLDLSDSMHKIVRTAFFNVIAATFYERYDEILNFYNYRSSVSFVEV